MKFTKKLIAILIISLFVFPFLINNYADAKAKTLRDLNNELSQLEANDAKNKNDIKLTETQINQTKADINQISIDMTNISNEIVQKTNEIAQLNVDIKGKDAEIKELMSFLQLSANGSEYLEYIVGAKTLTDFIYRVSVVEQLAKYNKELIQSMNEKIKENEAKKIELNNETAELARKQIDLNAKKDSLGKTKDSLYEYNQSLADEIKTSREVINMYEKAGCKLDDDINVCANKMLPPDTSFWRPIVTGHISSEYGYRIHPIYHILKFHDGDDMTTAGTNVSVYAAAAGKVAKIGYDSSMGNYIIIHHNIKGTAYTTQYLHLKTGSINVKEGAIVSKDTVLAIMGATGDATGIHLHFTVATGLRYKDYFTYSDFVNHTMSPRLAVNFPSGSGVWRDRTSRYN